MSTGGRVVSVEFFDGASSVGMASGTPWRSTLVNASTGSHSITAKATDDHGLTTTSRASTFTIRGANRATERGAYFAERRRQVCLRIHRQPDRDGNRYRRHDRRGRIQERQRGRQPARPRNNASVRGVVDEHGRGVVWPSWPWPTTTAMQRQHRLPFTSRSTPNVLPTVALTAPVANARFTAPASIAIAANASDSDGTIAKVEFYSGSTLIGSSSSAPYTATWSNVGSGSYSITAKATDNVGGVAVSAAAPITVVNNALPTVVLTAPGPGGQYFAPATIALSASATDSDGTIASVQFYANGSLIGTSTAAPYGMVWDGVAGGTYSLTAKATDNVGGMATSPAVNITIVGATGPQYRQQTRQCDDRRRQCPGARLRVGAGQFRRYREWRRDAHRRLWILPGERCPADAGR